MESSLQRLLSLDKAFDTLSQRVEEAARILSLPLHAPSDPSTVNVDSPVPLTSDLHAESPVPVASGHSARLEFVLRWLLDKLKTQPAARQSTHPWTLLRLVLQHLPPPALARALSASQITSIFTQALADSFPAADLSLSQSTPDTPQPSKKRKRHSLADEPPSHASLSIFSEIAASLRVLLARSATSPSAPNAAVENHLQALLRLDPPHLVRFTKHWLLALLRLTSLQPTPTSLVSSSMATLQSLLVLQPIPSTDSSADSFCTQCLWPAALLLRSLHSALHPDTPSYNDLQHAVHLLERLVAHQLFVPARAAFYSARDASILPPKKRPQSQAPSLAERLAPLHSEMAALFDMAPHPEAAQNNLLSLACGCLPLLLDLAVRCSPTATPKQRLAEAPWIDLLFANLSDTLAHSHSHSASAPYSEQISQTLGQMLDVLLQRNLVLGSELLSRVLDQNCHLLPSEDDTTQKPEFPLISKVLAMDSGVFTDIDAKNTQLLFEALSVYGRAPLPSQSDSVPADAWPNPRAICHKIVLPLMKAYARTRNLGAFLDHWFLCLKAQSSLENSEWYIWTDPSLEDSLREVLETSLTPAQIAELLELRLNALVESLSSNPDLTQAFASTVLLNAIVGAVRTDTTVDVLLPNFESMVIVVEDLFGRLQNLYHFPTTHLISLLSQLYNLWYPIWSTAQSDVKVEAKSAAMLEGPVIHYTLSRIQQSTKTQKRLPQGDVIEADAAFFFIASVCDMQRRLATHQEEYAQLFCRAALSLEEGDISHCYAVQRPGSFLTTMAGFPSLLSCVPSAQRVIIFNGLFERLLDDKTLSQLLLDEFLDAFFSAGDFSTKDDLFTAVCSLLEGANAPDLALNVLLQWPLKGLSRQQREKTLDVITSSSSWQKGVNQNKQRALDLIATLLEIPNATAKIALDPTVLWSLAETDYDRSELDAFEDVCTHLLGHILDTREQDRSKAYISGLSKKVAKFMNKEQDLALSSAPAKVRLVTAFFGVTEARLEEAVLSELPHRSPETVDSFIKRLYEALSDLSEAKSKSDDEVSEKFLKSAEAFAHTPVSLVSCGGSSTKKYSKRFTKTLNSFLNASSSSEAIEDTLMLQILVQCLEQLSPAILEESPFKLCTTAERLLTQDLDARQHRIITDAFTRSIRSIPDTERISLIDRLIPASELQCTAERVVLVQCIVSSLQIRSKDDTSAGAAFLLVRLLKLLETCADYNTHRQLAGCIIAVLRDQPNLVTQYTAEMTIATVTILASPSSPLRSTKQAPSIFECLCGITQSLLQFHRSSLGGRFHLLIPLLQRLLACLFLPSSKDAGTANRFKHPPWLDSAVHSLTVKHAQKYSRLLENLCSPPQSNTTSHRGKMVKSTPDLVDETRKARMHVAQHAPHILHYFCTLSLHGRLGEGMRDALTPGMWTVIGVAEMGADDTRGVKALSSSMGNAERAVLRSIWEDWRRFGGAWKG